LLQPDRCHRDPLKPLRTDQPQKTADRSACKTQPAVWERGWLPSRLELERHPILAADGRGERPRPQDFLRMPRNQRSFLKPRSSVLSRGKEDGQGDECLPGRYDFESLRSPGTSTLPGRCLTSLSLRSVVSSSRTLAATSIARGQWAGNTSDLGHFAFPPRFDPPKQLHSPLRLRGSLSSRSLSPTSMDSVQP